MNLYNDNDPFCAAWLRNLIADGHLPEGKIDERDIRDLAAADLRDYRQVHLFAGIGGWPYALRLAEWPEDAPVWTASLPCPSFSVAGKRRGVEDPRHLWPFVYPLIAELRPPTIFGEQVEGAIAFGWLDGIFADLERERYACGAAVLPACSVGAPHIRQRLFWVAHAQGTELSGTLHKTGRPKRRGAPCGVADAKGEQMGRAGHPRERAADGLGDADEPRPQGCRESGQRASELAPWAASRLIACADGRTRRIPVEPALHPLADGVSRRVGILRGAGNAIVPQVAAAFIEAFVEAKNAALLGVTELETIR